MYQSTIDNNEILSLPRLLFEGEITVIDTYEKQLEVWEVLSKCDVVGFDTESRASFKKGQHNEISMIQLSGAGRAFLIRLNITPLSKEVINILQSKRIKKIGVAIKDDISELRKKATIYPQNFIDLQKIVGDYGISELGLKKISAIVLGGALSKAQRLSNWNAVRLTDAQIKYAATDAWVCEEIYNKLLGVKK